MLALLKRETRYSDLEECVTSGWYKVQLWLDEHMIEEDIAPTPWPRSTPT